MAYSPVYRLFTASCRLLSQETCSLSPRMHARFPRVQFSPFGSGSALGLLPSPFASNLSPSIRPSLLHRPLSSSVVAHASAGASKSLPPGVSRLVERTDCEVVYSRSGGAGGQNVNKVNTKVDLRLDLSKCGFLSPEVKDAIRKREGNRVNKEDLFIVKSEVHRTQYQNLDDALERMNEMIESAARSLIVVEPTAEKKKRIRSLSRAYEESRIKEKKAQARRKQERKGGYDDY